MEREYTVQSGNATTTHTLLDSESFCRAIAAHLQSRGFEVTFPSAADWEKFETRGAAPAHGTRFTVQSGSQSYVYELLDTWVVVRTLPSGEITREPWWNSEVPERIARGNEHARVETCRTLRLVRTDN